MTKKTANPKDVLPGVDHTFLVIAAQAHLDNMDAWSFSNNFANALKYQYKAEAIIEMLESFHSGSIGGFAPGQKRPINLQQRLNWFK